MTALSAKQFFSKFSFSPEEKFGAEVEAIIADEEGRPSAQAFEILKQVAKNFGIPFEEWQMQGGCIKNDFWLKKLKPAFEKACIKPEMFLEQIELTTTPHSNLEELQKNLQQLRNKLLNLCGQYDVIPMYTSLPLVAPDSVNVFPVERYQKIAQKEGPSLADGFTNSLHLHASVSSLEEGLFLLRLARRYLPVFLAFSANSPLFNMKKTGWASSRIMKHLNFIKQNQIPPIMKSPQDYYLAMKNERCLEDSRNCWWWVRLNFEGHVCTIELRITDGLNLLDEWMIRVSLWAAFTRYGKFLWRGKAVLHDPSSEEVLEKCRLAATHALANQGLLSDTRQLLDRLEKYYHNDEKEYFSAAKKIAASGNPCPSEKEFAEITPHEYLESYSRAIAF